MDFLHPVEGLVKGVAQAVANPVSKVLNDAGAGVLDTDALIQELSHNQQGSDSLQQRANEVTAPGGGLLHQGGVTGEVSSAPLSTKNAEQIAGTGAEIGSNFVGGGAAKDVAEDAVQNGAKNLSMDFIKGAKGGGAAGGIYQAGAGATQGEFNPEQIAEGAAEGAAAGGVLGAAAPAISSAIKARTPLNEVGAINPGNIPKVSEQFSDDDLQKMANSDDPKDVEKQLTPVTGPAVAKEIAPGIVQAKDPNVAANIIDQSVNNKVPPTLPNPSPAPAEISPPTPTSDVNTPAQIAGQASDEASLYASGQQQPFMNAPGETPSASSIGSTGTIDEMKKMINSGQYSNDEVLGHYFEQQPGAELKEAQGALDKAINSSDVDRSKINATLNPQSGKVSLAPVQVGDDTAAQLNGRYAGTKVGEAGTPALKDMEALDPHDRELTRYLRGKNPDEIQGVVAQAHDPQTFQSYIDSSKNYLDTAQALGAEQGQPLPYRVNYGGRTPYDPPEGLPEGSPDSKGEAGPANPENASYTQKRYFNTHEEALANGYTPKNEDPLEDLRNDINQRAYNNTQLALAHGYEQAHPGEVKMLNDNTQLPQGYHQLLVPGGEHIALPADIADKINERVVTSTPGKVLGKYDTINQTGKELELGGGTFHGFNTAGTFVGQQLASGKALTDLPATAKVVANFFSDSHMQSYLDNASKAPSGGLDENHSLIDGANASGLNIKNTSVDLKSPDEGGLASKVAGIPVLKQIHDAVFSRQIPTMMLETFRQKTQGLDIFGSAEDRLSAEKIARGINKEFGVTDHDLAGMTSNQFKQASRFILAPGYQEGVMHTLATALDPREFGSAEGKLAREAVLGKALLFGGLATLGSVAGGDFKGMDSKQVALSIMNKAINPSFNIGGYKVSTPATNISDLAKPIEESVAGYQKNGDALTGAEDFGNSHLAFAPAKIEEVAANKNYEGNPIRGTDYYGRPISGGETAANLAEGILPIPLAQGEQTATGAENPAAAVANTVGLNARPQNSMQYAPIYGQTYMSELEKTPGISKAQVNSDSEFFSALGSGKEGRSKVLTQAETYLAQAEKSTDPAKEAQLRAKAVTTIDSYNKQLVKALVPWADSKVNTSYMDSTMLSILRSSMITLKAASENVSYDTKTNPTAYGVPIQALSTPPQTAAFIG